MCGIIGVLGKCNCFNRLHNGLKQLQNRGYDSSGICSVNKKGDFVLDKIASTDGCSAMDALEKCETKHIHNTIGIGHTRWATHGPKTNKNAHPHIDTFDTFSLVHNGIIENYQQLKDMLLCNGYKFQSQTDTEVVVNLISYEYYNNCNKNVKKAILCATKQLSGTYALAILCINNPDKIYCIRHGSPLLIGITDTFAIVTSEQSGFNGELVNYYVLDNDNLCVLSKNYNGGNDKDGIEFYAQKSTYRKLKVSNDIDLSLKAIGEFPHWTLKEIYEQQESCARAMTNGGRLCATDKVRIGGFIGHELQLLKIKHLILLGCGTSYHAGLIARNYFKDFCKFTTVQIFDGAEFDESEIPQGADVGCILLSQSGETRDLYRCIQLVKNSPNNVYLVGVVNVVDSLISREVDCGVYLNAGREVAVASTKSFTSQLVVLMLIALWFSQNQEVAYSKRKQCISELRNLQNNVERVLDISKNAITDEIVNAFKFPSCFLLGKGTGEGVAKEAALKIKEIAYIHAEGYSASALKHGPFALLEKDFPVIILGFGHGNNYEKCINALEEIKSRGAKIIFITNHHQTQHKTKADYVIQLPSTNTKYTADILSIIPLQMLAYKLSLKRGLNPDFPRNLAKVVTVD